MKQVFMTSFVMTLGVVAFILVCLKELHLSPQTTFSIYSGVGFVVGLSLILLNLKLPGQYEITARFRCFRKLYVGAFLLHTSVFSGALLLLQWSTNPVPLIVLFPASALIWFVTTRKLKERFLEAATIHQEQQARLYGL